MSAIRRLIHKKLGYALYESVHSPLEMFSLIQEKPSQRKMYAVSRLLENEKPAGFIAERKSEELVYFRSSSNANKLLVCFTDKHGSLFHTVAEFLQLIGDKDFDVLVLHDRRRFRFSIGLDGLTGSLRETAAYIRDITQNKNYRKTVTYGTSMGGFVAARAGILMGADLSIAVGGSFLNVADYYDSGGKFTIPTEQICACQNGKDTQIVLAFSANSYLDVQNAKHFKSICPHAQLLPCNSAKHDIYRELGASEKTRKFLKRLLGGDCITSDFYDALVSADYAVKLRQLDKGKKLIT